MCVFLGFWRSGGAEICLISANAQRTRLGRVGFPDRPKGPSGRPPGGKTASSGSPTVWACGPARCRVLRVLLTQITVVLAARPA
jgi:hypothetical protein